MFDRRMAPHTLVALLCATVWGAGALAANAAPHAEGSPIFGAQAAEPCQWPTTVLLRFGGTCTGTLVHPEIVLYAAHCGTGFTQIEFGEDASAIQHVAPVDHCARFSNSGQVSSEDYAYCRLAEPVTFLPTTPVLYGCEEDAFEAGAEVAIVGFGRDEDGVVGIKRWAMTQVNSVLGLANIGGMGTGADEGDSGGPAFIRLEDGSWRTAALVTGGQGEGSAINYVPISSVVPWVESQSGVDITPCHEVDGTWAPTPSCSGFALDPTNTGAWEGECGGPRQGPSESCGPSFTTLDSIAPEIAFVAPADGDIVEPGIVDVLADATDEGFGVAQVELWVDGELASTKSTTPYEFEVELEDGAHTLTSTARDFVGLQASATIEVEVEAAGDEDSAPGEGCGCSTGSDSRRGLGLLGWLFLLSVAAFRRRGG